MKGDGFKSELKHFLKHVLEMGTTKIFLMMTSPYLDFALLGMGHMHHRCGYLFCAEEGITRTNIFWNTFLAQGIKMLHFHAGKVL